MIFLIIKTMLSIYRLPNKLPNEKIVKVLRRDYFILFKKIVLFALLFALPYLVFKITISSFPGLQYGALSYPLIVLGGSAFYLFVLVFFFFSFIDYYLDIWIITNERIIDVRQQGFFSRIISENRLRNIQDVSSEVHGFFPTVLKYGDVHIQTAGTELKFRFHEIPNPDKTRDTIIKITEECKLRHQFDKK